MKLPTHLLSLAALACASLAWAQVPTWPKTTPTEITAAGINAQLSGADYGNATFVLSGYLGGTTAVPAVTAVAFTSPDGATWTKRTLPVDGRTSVPRFLNGRFYLGVSAANGGSGVILSSADGATWTSTGVIDASLNAPNDYAFGNGIYLAAVSRSGSSAFQIVTSADGVSWKPRSIVAGSQTGHVAFFAGKFYATVWGAPSATADGLYTSADAQVWTRVAGAPANPGILAASSSALLTTFFSGSTSGQSVSSDGVTFTTASPGISLQTETIRFLNGGFVTSASGSPTDFDLNLARASVDGRTWVTIGSTANKNYAPEIAYGGGRYVFVGEFDVFTGMTTLDGGSGGGGGGSGVAAPVVSAQPAASQTIAVGGGITFTFTVTGTGITFQWYLNGVAIPGATNATYTISAVTAAQAGTYTVTATNAGGSVTSTPSVLVVAPISTATAARLSNVSIRANTGSGSQKLIVGLTVGGAGTSGTKTLLVRGTGPALATFGVAGVLPDPELTVFSGATVVATNDDWNNDAQVVAQGNAVGAFPLAAGSKDAAMVGVVARGGYTTHLTGKAGTTGVGLVEVYDATTTFTAATPRLTNVSARTQVGTGDNILIVGFVVTGSGTRQVLIRAIGPGLVPFAVSGTLADPKLELYNAAATKIGENDDWGASTATAQSSAGAFELAGGSKDAVLVATLPAGSYTAQVRGAGGASGVALLEVYELP